VNHELGVSSRLLVAGDAASLFFPELGRRRPQLVETAIRTGQIAGARLAGRGLAPEGVTSELPCRRVVLPGLGLRVHAVGDCNSELESWGFFLPGTASGSGGSRACEKRHGASHGGANQDDDGKGCVSPSSSIGADGSGSSESGPTAGATENSEPKMKSNDALDAELRNRGWLSPAVGSESRGGRVYGTGADVEPEFAETSGVRSVRRAKKNRSKKGKKTKIGSGTSYGGLSSHDRVENNGGTGGNGVSLSTGASATGQSMRDGVVFYVKHGSVVGALLWRRTKKTGPIAWLEAEHRHSVNLGLEEHMNVSREQAIANSSVRGSNDDAASTGVSSVSSSSSSSSSENSVSFLRHLIQRTSTDSVRVSDGDPVAGEWALRALLEAAAARVLEEDGAVERGRAMGGLVPLRRDGAAALVSPSDREVCALMGLAPPSAELSS